MIDDLMNAVRFKKIIQSVFALLVYLECREIWSDKVCFESLERWLWRNG